MTATICYLFLDVLWLSFTSNHIYLTELRSILRLSGNTLDPRWPAVFITYFLIISGILIFAVPKAKGNVLLGFLWGAFFGLLSYGIYDFTNLSTLSAWTLKITLIDVLWGITNCGLTTAITVLLTKSRGK